MNRIIKKYRQYLLLAILLILGVYSLIGYLRAGEFGLTNLDVRDLDTLTASRASEFLKGDTFVGTFRSKYTNLGIISLRFYNENRDSEDTLVFRLREKDASDWIYTAKYETNQFQPHKHFPFGFPIIPNSDNREYEFQLESLRGATGSGILIDYSNQPIFIAKSSYTKGNLLSNGGNLLYFIKNKIVNVFGDPEIRFNIFLFFLPLALYLVFIIFEGVSFHYFTLSVLLLVLYDIFWLLKFYDFFYFGVVLYWWLVLRRDNIESQISTILSISLLVVVTVLTVFIQNDFAEKTAIWSYLFFCITAIQQIFAVKSNKTKVVTIASFVTVRPFFRVNNGVWFKKITKIYNWISQYNLKTINMLSARVLIQSLPRQYEEISPWLQQVPALIKRVCVLLLSALAVLLLALYLGYVIIYPPIFGMIESLAKFAAFYPSDYINRYLVSIMLPDTILVVSLIYLVIKLKNTFFSSKWLIVIPFIILNLVTGRIISNAIKFESQPRIISVSPSMTGEAWTDVVVSGKNFRNLPFVGKIYIGNVEQGEYLVLWSDEKIIFRTSPKLSVSGDVWVAPLGREPSNKVPFLYTFK